MHPVTLLCPQLRARRGEEAAARSWLMVVDQYGNLHPPSGTARAMLVGREALTIPPRHDRTARDVPQLVLVLARAGARAAAGAVVE